MEPFHVLRDKVPSDVRLAMSSLRGKAERDICDKEDLKDLNKMLAMCQRHGMVWGDFALIFTVEKHEDAIYGHLSVSHRKRYPSWDELMIFRCVFFDDDDEVIQVLPKASEYINIHQRCFHLWHKHGGRIISL